MLVCQNLMVNFHFILDDIKEKPNVSWYCGVEETNRLEEYFLHSETIEPSKEKKMNMCLLLDNGFKLSIKYHLIVMDVSS